jgi:uncharacterized protein (UPF0276 family)
MNEQHLPPRAGVGLKGGHFSAVDDGRPDVGWFEVHAENYMGAGGPAHYYLERIREAYPLSIHGVGLSIGSNAPLDPAHLSRLKAVVDRYEPQMFSEHLAWSSHGGVYLNDLLPLPYTSQTLERVSEHIDQVQAVLGRRMLLENPSTYVDFESSTMSETGFLEEVARRTGCGLLLDVNNVYVSATNLGYPALEYIAEFPLERVGEIHLAGHAPDRDEAGRPLLVDAHDRPVADEVWSLYAATLEHTGPLPTLIEWDNDVPEWPVLLNEANAAQQALDRCRGGARRAAAG